MKFKVTFKEKILPILLVILLFLLVLIIAYPFSALLKISFSQETLNSNRWLSSAINHFTHIIATIFVMLVLGDGLKKCGLKLNSNNLYIIPALILGVSLGVIMTVVDHFPSILSGIKINDYELTPLNIIDSLCNDWLLSGTSEEILVRGLMMTFLMNKFNHHTRIIKWDVHNAGVIVAVLFALMHLQSFWTGKLIYAIGQQIYAFAFALFSAYFYEKSGSILAPIIAHNLANGIESILMFYLIWLGY